jgi:hypothetical protein
MKKMMQMDANRKPKLEINVAKPVNFTWILILLQIRISIVSQALHIEKYTQTSSISTKSQ